MTLLPPTIQQSLHDVVARTVASGACIRVILISTTDGVPLGRVYANDEPWNEEVMASMESLWAPAAKQIPALTMGKLTHVTAIYDHGVLCHAYESPVVRINDYQSRRVYQRRF
jgi:hypothetical protein